MTSIFQVKFYSHKSFNHSTRDAVLSSCSADTKSRPGSSVVAGFGLSMLPKSKGNLSIGSIFMRFYDSRMVSDSSRETMRRRRRGSTERVCRVGSGIWVGVGKYESAAATLL